MRQHDKILRMGHIATEWRTVRATGFTNASRPWEKTAAYHLERHIGHWIHDMGGLSLAGGAGTRGHPSCQEAARCKQLQEFASDGLHLWEYGYSMQKP